MPVEDFDKYMELARLLPNSWGTGSQLNSVSQSIKFQLRDDKLMKANFMMIVNIPNSKALAIEMKTRYRNEALQMLKGALETLAEKFKDATGKAIKLKMMDSSVNDGVEYLTNVQYNPNKHAYFRLDALVEVE